MSSWLYKEEETDFYDIKGTVEALFSALNIRENIKFSAMPRKISYFMRKGYAAEIFAKGKYIGYIGELNEKISRNYGLKQKVFIFEIDTNLLSQIVPEIVKADAISKFPAVARDMTLIVAKDITADDIVATIEESKEKFIEIIEVFDLYKGEKIDSDKKSVSFRIIYRSHENTLKDGDVTPIHERLAKNIIRKFNADLPV